VGTPQPARRTGTMTEQPQPRIVRAPNGAEFLLPPDLPAGQQPPPMPVRFDVSLTEPDTAGRVWIVWQFSDSTTTWQVRIPWQVAAGFAQQLLQATGQVAARAQALSGPTLITPDMMGGLPPLPPPNGGGRG
jgi:hypothetical protein